MVFNFYRDDIRLKINGKFDNCNRFFVLKSFFVVEQGELKVERVKAVFQYRIFLHIDFLIAYQEKQNNVHSIPSPVTFFKCI